MELLHLHHAPDFPTSSSLSKSTFSVPPTYVLSLRRRPLSPPAACAAADVDAAPPVPSMAAPEHAGGKMVVELVGAFNELTERMNVLSTSSSRLLFKSLKLSIPILQNSPLAPDGRSPLSKALSVAMVLADLQVKIK